MANLNGTYNPDAGEMGERPDPLPEGEYVAMITDSEWKDTKSGNGKYLCITFEVVDDEYKGRKVFINLNLDNPNETAVKIAQQELNSICRAVNVVNPSDSAQVHGIPLCIGVKLEKSKNKEGKEFVNNVIKSYRSRSSGNAVQGKQTAATTTANGVGSWRNNKN